MDRVHSHFFFPPACRLDSSFRIIFPSFCTFCSSAIAINLSKAIQRGGSLALALSARQRTTLRSVRRTYGWRASRSHDWIHSHTVIFDRPARMGASIDASDSSAASRYVMLGGAPRCVSLGLRTPLSLRVAELSVAQPQSLDSTNALRKVSYVFYATDHLYCCGALVRAEAMPVGGASEQHLRRCFALFLTTADRIRGKVCIGWLRKLGSRAPMSVVTSEAVSPYLKQKMRDLNVRELALDTSLFPARKEPYYRHSLAKLTLWLLTEFDRIV